MSLFERIQNKRYDLQEKKKRYQKKVDHGFGDDSGKKTGGFEDITGEGIKRSDYPRTRKELEAKRKFYEIDPKTNQPSKAGIEKYARKHKELSSGSNIPVELTQADLDKAKRNMVGGEPVLMTGTKGLKDKIGRTTGKIGGRVADKDPKIAKMTDAQKAENIAKIKAKIDAKNPVIQTPVGPLPKTAKNMKKFPQPTFKNFTKNLASKGGKYLKNLPMKNKLGLAALGTVAAIGAFKKFTAPPKDTLTARDFKKSKTPITKSSGDEVRRTLFLSTKQEKQNKEPRISGDRLTRNKNFTAKIKSGEYRTT